MNASKTAANRPNPEASRNLISISPFFIVKDLQTSIAFYRERLGFQLDFQGPEGDVYYAGVSRDGIGIMLKEILPDVLPCPNHTRHEWARWDAYIYTLDPDTLFEEFRARGVSFVKELSFIDEGLWGFEITMPTGTSLPSFSSATRRATGRPSLRATVKMVAFVLSLFAAMFSASTGYGLLKMLLQAMNSGTNRDSGALYTWRSDYRFLCARWVERVCSKKDTVSVNTIAAFLSSLACAFGDASEMRGQR